MNIWTFEAIGTQWRISVYQAVAADALKHVKRAVAARIKVFDQTYSRFRPDSLVTAVSQAAGTYEFPDDSTSLLTFYKKLYDVTDGAVTPLIGRTLSEAGYDVDYSLQPGKLSPPPAWGAALAFTGRQLTTKLPVLLDFGAAGKGYLVDIVADLLQNQGIGRFCVDASGDMVIRGLGSGLPVGLEHPDDPEQVIGIVDITDRAICGSAGNRRKWAGYNHILDPHSLRSPQHIAATWCMAADALAADGLATALYFTSPEKLQKHFSFEYCMMLADGTAEYSAGFKAGMFTEAATVAA